MIHQTRFGVFAIDEYEGIYNVTLIVSDAGPGVPLESFTSKEAAIEFCNAWRPPAK